MPYVLLFVLFLVAHSAVFAGDFADAKEKFVDIPKSQDEPWENWQEPYDETFLPFHVCSEPKSLQVVEMKEKVESYWDDADGIIEAVTQDHGYCLFSIVKIVYNVTCLNKLQYRGEKHLFSDDKCKKSGWLHGNFKAEENEFLANRHGWQNMSLDSLKPDGSVTDYKTDFKTWKYEGKFNKEELIGQLKMQEVAYPEWKYTGVPGKKLAVPILFIHGLGDDYKSWGVTSTVDADELCENDAVCAKMWPSFCDVKFVSASEMQALQKKTCTDELKEKIKEYKEALLKANADFQKGSVRKYTLGSAPDIIVRNQNIYITDDNINSDGIYFFQALGKINEEKKWEETSLDWDNAYAQNSQSRKLYQKLEEILDDFFKDTPINWRETPEATVDIVAHSQGGLVVREMLRGLRAEKASMGSDNPANHIRRMITVDTPHLGAATAAESSEDIKEYSGLGKIVDDLNNPKNHNLVNVKISPDYTNWLTDFLVLSVNSFLGWAVSTAVVTADYEINMNGPYLGPYTISLNVDPLIPGSFAVDLTDRDPLADLREKANYTRSIGKHLYSESNFMKNLNNGKDGASYPKKPNGDNLEIVPLYSGNTKAVVSAALETIAENLKISCPELDDSDSKAACVSLESYLESKASDFEDMVHGLIDVNDIDLNQNLLDILNSLVNDWLANSDLIVESNSQKYESEKLGISSGSIPELKTPRKFEFHDALAPWETVAHLNLKMGNMAASARQGLDIACALHLYCSELLAEKAGLKLIYLDDGSVGLTGDFDLSPLYLGVGKQGVRVSDDSGYLEAIYEPGVGSYVNYTDSEGNLQQDVMLQPGIATNPRLRRKGSVITVSFDNQSGKTFSKDYAKPKMSPQAIFSIVADEGASLPKVIAGLGTASDLSLQAAPVSPTAWKKTRDVFVMHREARGDYESNTSRPRMLVANSTDKDIKGFKVAYYFTADPARNPVVEVDYPRIPVILENLGGDQWRFVLNAADSVLKARSVFPSLDGWQIRLHYGDWTDFDHLDDWSADYNVGIPRNNKKIVVYDADGHILWGQEPSMYRSVDDGVIASPKGVLSWSDSAPWESNIFKPRVTVKNTGTVALKNYHAKLWFRVPDGKSLYVPIDDWYTPVSRPGLKNIGENVWELDMHFDTYMLYPNESVAEGNVGLHLTDWSTFDKLVCGIALIDSEETVIFGKVPSVEECSAYALPSYLNIQYVWRN